MATDQADSGEEAPRRKYMDDPAIVWRSGRPDFTSVNKSFLEGRTKKHKSGSLEQIVQDLVKTWEMEASHKIRAEDWQTVDRQQFCISSNNQKKFNLEDCINMGNYNILMQNQPLYDASQAFESSHDLFRGAFPDGFPWELLEVFSGPPRVVFSWRHWAHWKGPYKDRAPTGELVEMFGVAIVDVDENLKIKTIDVQYDPNQILMPLEGRSGCPMGFS